MPKLREQELDHAHVAELLVVGKFENCNKFAHIETERPLGDVGGRSVFHDAVLH